MKRWIPVALALCALLAGTLCAWALPASPAAELVLHVPEGATATRPTVTMPHAQHEFLDCLTCHHTAEQSDQSFQSCSAQGCHDDTTTKRGEHAYFLAFHSRDSDHSCRGCHKLRQDRGESHGPSACADCHKPE